MTFPDEVLMAYADDELDARTRAAVEAAMASDPEIARRIAQHRALRNRVQSAFDRVLDEPVPARLLRVVRSDPARQRDKIAGSGFGRRMPALWARRRDGAEQSNVVPLRRHRAQRWAWPQWTAIAASLIVGVIAGRLALLRAGNPGPIITRAGRVLASGTLAVALSDQLAAGQAAADPVRIGVSFRSKSGEYCRTFTLRQPASAGLACRAADGWEVNVLARAEPPDVLGGSGTYRQAASSMPAAVVAVVSDEIAGEPLDASAEAAARGRHWRP